eukprot:11208589-Alexandrium_andersonii.AAC.1
MAWARHAGFFRLRYRGPLPLGALTNTTTGRWSALATARSRSSGRSTAIFCLAHVLGRPT